MVCERQSEREREIHFSCRICGSTHLPCSRVIRIFPIQELRERETHHLLPKKLEDSTTYGNIEGLIVHRNPSSYRPKRFHRHAYQRRRTLRPCSIYAALCRWITMDESEHGRRSLLLVKLGRPIAYLSSKGASLLGNAKVHAAAACVQILYAGFQVLASVALSNGASKTVFPVYRNAIAALLIGVIAFFTERRTMPALTFVKLFQLFLSGLVGVCINQTLFLSGLYYTSATFAATFQNLTPALTFVVAVVLGIEQVKITKFEGQAKILGVLVGAGGAMLIALYKGPSIVAGDGSFLLSYADARNELTLESSSYVSLNLGLLCLLGNCATWAIWFIMQNPVLRDYPAQLSATAFTYIFGTIQLAIIAICVERDLDTWATTFYSDLPAILYGGLVASGVAMTLQGWCAYRGGPVLVAAYQPLQTILVAILSSTFLHEAFYVGSLIGGLFIIIGLYLVVWGKSREIRVNRSVESQKFNLIAQSLLNSTEIEDGLTDPLLA